MRRGYHDYLDQEVLEATPIRLVELLYRGALEAIASARRYLKAGDIRARSRAISKAMEIITELSRSLNQEAGGEIGRNLAELYSYTETLLIEANSRQSDPPLAEAETLLSTLAEAWGNCAGSQPAPSAFLTTDIQDQYAPIGYAR